jgi:simple sugar transport system permease protein
VPQTRTFPVPERLPRLFDTTIHFGVVIALVAILAVHFVMTRTAFGLKLCVVGANPRAAVHAGLPMARLTFATFALSAALIGMGGAVEILGVHGTVRADWNPGYGLLVVPLVFLARFNGIASILFVLFFAALQIGGESAARRLDVPHYYVLLLVSLVLLFLAIVEYLDHVSARRSRAA